MDVDRLLRAANPVPEDRGRSLSGRAERELHVLVGDDGRGDDGEAAPAAATRRHRTPVSRPRLALVTGAVAVAVLGGVAVAATLRPEPPPPAADEPFYGTTQELEARADVIVRGTVTATRETTDEGYPQTLGTVEVTAVAVGGVAPGDELTASWVTPGATALSENGPRTGGEYVLLLEDVEGLLVLVSQTQGWYPVTDGAAAPADGNPVPLAPQTLELLGLG